MSVATLPAEIDDRNKWRAKSPGHNGWVRSPRPGADSKYLIISVDSHITPPPTLISSRIEEKYKEKLPRAEKRDDGLYMIVDGMRPFRVVQSSLEGEDAYRAKAGVVGEDPTEAIETRMADMDFDGIDAEVVFPNGPALMAYFTKDSGFAQAQFRIYNDWAAELNARWGQRMKIAACVSTSDVDSAVAEVERAAKLGMTILSLPTQPVPGLEESTQIYNHARFDPLWAAIQDTGMAIAMHVATGGDPRKARGPGGAIMNRAKSHEALCDPITAFCASGILDRFEKLRFAAVEGGIGWLPALLDLMDETYVKHHMWVFPKLKQGLPSDYFREHAIASFQEDRAGLLLVEPYDLQNNICWSNDYPHHEGTFPHSAAAIERGFGHLQEETRTKILGLNAARFFGFDVPDGYPG